MKRKSILNKIQTFNYQFTITRNVEEHLDVIVNDVKFTFFDYPYPWLDKPVEVGGFNLASIKQTHHSNYLL